MFRRAVRRTTGLRISFAVAVAATAALELGLARGGGITEAAYLPSGGTTVVVVDFSYSITGGDTYRSIVNALRKVAAAGRPVGLIGFSDTAYELLPPGTPARELEPVADRFVPTVAKNGAIRFPPSPWAALQGGTKISAGLVLARDVLRRDHVKKGAVLLISDLETSSEDQSAVVDAVGALQGDGISLHLVGLEPSAPALHFFEGLVGTGAVVNPRSLAAPVARGSSRLLSGQTPWSFLLGAALLALLLAGNERLVGALDLSGLGRNRP